MANQASIDWSGVNGRGGQLSANSPLDQGGHQQSVIRQVSIIGGKGRDGLHDAIDRLDLNMGDVVSVVGPTGSGKTTLINDMELFADGDTPTGRRILINGETPPEVFRDDPSRNPIALITQHTSFLSDLPVDVFLHTHAGIRRSSSREADELVRQTLDFANQLTGEPISLSSSMTELSGGQTRSLLIADATIICDTPIVLLDEVENAGINRSRALELLRGYKKIFIFVTHDPRIALLSDYRIILRDGRIADVLKTDARERALAPTVARFDDVLSDIRDRLRQGLRIENFDFGDVA
ncbi:ABC transporter ATP-binding protein [Rhodoblastus sphagnicola]|uniref:ABC transporter ATP-binding protein n=1 Tax=Rhodoblastus sphagnicola TaxID=333368 RepID=A0A2S6NDR0_9HYPH|nr:ATP-binding cassette domain-containing protein [Rhodoblastus sphagnicola]MBB4198526.1 ABC-type lipoprotein export system ATPase subunit [Rhodoblastus sphagnicola]PPQ32758.1 ABC transporter ATP-binding protein [Rhodoblastus sphagnicola]